jgi:hypothetical protein
LITPTGRDRTAHQKGSEVMLKLRSLIAAGLILPLIAFGSALGAGEIGNASNALSATGAEETAFASAVGGAENYKCWWTYYMGNWWCVPC